MRACTSGSRNPRPLGRGGCQNLIIHDEKYRYDNNHIVKSLQNIEKYLAKQQPKRQPLTKFLSVFNNKFGNKSLSDTDSVQKVEFFPNQTVSK